MKQCNSRNSRHLVTKLCIHVEAASILYSACYSSMPQGTALQFAGAVFLAIEY